MSDPSKSVFISYASEDLAAALRLCTGLRAANIEVWFDQSELTGGEDWDARIRGRIRSCFLFVPIISVNTEKRLEGYFRREWKMAADRTHSMARGKAFLLPVHLGRPVNREAEVPDEFRLVHWTCLDEGEVTPSFLAQVQHLIGNERAPAKPRTERNPRAVSRGKHSPRRRAWPLLLSSGLLLVLACLFVLSKSSAPGLATRPSAAAAAVPSQVASPKSIAVLPLGNPAADPEAGALAEALQSEIISALSRLPDLVVTPLDATLAFKARDRPVSEIAQELNVSTVITGSVLRAGNRIRPQLELRQASYQGVLWSKTYEVELKNAQSAATSISDEVARVLEARETRGTYASAKFTTTNAVAADLFSKAWALIKATDSSTESMEQGVELAEECIQLDSGFTSAAVLLADAHARLFSRYTDPDKRSSNAAESKDLAEKASRMTQGCDGMIGLAIYYIKVEHDPARGLAFVENSLRALPNEALSYHLKAIALSQTGKLDQATEQDRLALALDPLMGEYWENILIYLARLRRPVEWTSTLKGCQAANPDRLSADRLAEARFQLTGELPSEPFDPAQGRKSTWQWRARRFKDELASLGTEMAAKDISEVDRLMLLLRESDALQRLGRGAESANASRAAVEVAEHLKNASDPDPSRKAGWLAQALARVDRADEAIVAARRYVGAVSASEKSWTRWKREIEFAELYAYLKRPRECMALLSELLRQPSGLSVPMLRVDPTWDSLRDDPGFKLLLLDSKNLGSL